MPPLQLFPAFVESLRENQCMAAVPVGVHEVGLELNGALERIGRFIESNQMQIGVGEVVKDIRREKKTLARVYTLLKKKDSEAKSANA